MPLGRQMIISTGKLYFSRCRSASLLWNSFSLLLCKDTPKKRVCTHQN